MRKNLGWLMLVVLALSAGPLWAYVIGYDMENTVYNLQYGSPDNLSMANILSAPASSDSNAGVFQNGAVQSSEQAKFGHSSCKFTTYNSRLYPVPDTAMKLTGDMSQMTVMAHVYLLNIAGEQVIGSSSIGGFGNTWLFEVYGNRVHFDTRYDGTTASSYYTAAGLVAANTWTHLAATFNAGAVKIYINGVLAAQTTLSYTTLPYTNTYGYVGTHYWGSTFNGYMDDFYFNSAAALSADQIAYYSTHSITPLLPIQGKVALGGYTGSLDLAAVGIEASQSGNVIGKTTTVLNADGTFSTGLPVGAGTYDLAFKGYASLKKTLSGIALSSGTTTVQDPADPVNGIITLTAGDLDGDNEVTSTDLSILLANMQ